MHRGLPPNLTSDNAPIIKSDSLAHLIIHLIEASATGTLSMASLLANSQFRDGHRVRVIFSKRPETPENISDHFDDGIDLVNVQMREPAEKLYSIKKIRKEFKDANFIFLHSSFAGFIGRSASVGLSHAKIFYIPHCISFMRKDVGVVRKALFIALEWIAAMKSSTYIACSDSERRQITTFIPFRDCITIENAVDNNIHTEIGAAGRKNAKTVVTVGQIREQKGPYQFSEIAEAVRLADPEIEFIWIGDGDKHLRNVLETAGVRVSGWLDKQDVMAKISKASIYLSTARWEGMPVSLIEAIYCGTPIIASQCAGNVDVVDQDETGWLFNTTSQAVSCILYALSNPDRAEFIAVRARDVAHKRFDKARYRDEMLKLLNL